MTDEGSKQDFPIPAGDRMLGLIGILLTVIGSEFNDQVATVALADIRGGLAISHDSGTWFESLYVSAEIFGAGVSPWFLLTLSLRRWALIVSALAGMAGALIPFSPNEQALYALRVIEGVGGGAAFPMLLTAALRVLTPDARLYGLALYGLTSTLTPALGAPLAALWTNLVGWRSVFWEGIPIFTMGAALVLAGVPREPAQLDRFRKIDWRGMLMLVVVFGPFSTLLYQGDRLDWFNSTLICVLALISAVGLPLFVVNEWCHELPLFKLQMLGRPNLLFGSIELFLFLIIGQSSSTMPIQFLTQVQGFRPEQFAPLTGLVAGIQIVMLPLMAWVLDHERVDVRAVNLVGLLLVFSACAGASFATAYWYPAQFYLWQAVQAIGQPMVVLSMLMMSTNTIGKPEEGPFASALINMPRMVAEAAGAWLLNLVVRWRGELHYNRIVDQLGQDDVRLGSRAGALVQQQATVLTLSDAYLVFACLPLLAAVVLLLITKRTPPPRILLAGH